MTGKPVVAIMALAAMMAGCSTSVPVQLDSYSVSADDRRLTVSATLGEHDTIASVKADEDAARVTVIVRVNRAGGTGTLLGVVRDVDVDLSGPLAGRAVVDGTGHPVPRKQ